MKSAAILADSSVEIPFINAPVKADAKMSPVPETFKSPHVNSSEERKRETHSESESAKRDNGSVRFPFAKERIEFVHDGSSKEVKEWSRNKGYVFSLRQHSIQMG